jgi:hypothetical protein
MTSSLNLIFTNNTGLADDKVFVTFQNPQHAAADKQFNVTYGNGTAVPFAAPDNLMSESVSLQTIGGGGLTVEKVDGVVIYISYGQALTSTTSAPSYIGSGGTDYNTPFQPFELTRMGSSTDQGNMTAINYFTAPQSITSYNGGQSGSQLQQTGYVESAATIASDIAALCSGCVVRNGSGKIVRCIGPSSYPPPGGSPSQPWPSWASCLQSVHDAGQKTIIQNHNAFNGNDGNNYDFTLNLTAAVGPDNSIQLDGSITTKATPEGDEPTFSDASITIPGSPVDALDYIIYGQVSYTNVTWGQGWSVFKTFVDGKGIDGAYGTTQRLAIGEITTGLLLGFVNSSKVPAGRNTAIKNMPSEEWWTLNPMIAFSDVQSNSADYNEYANVIYKASNNLVYSIPYSDRLGEGPLINSVEYNGQPVDTWVVGLEAPVS